MEDLIIYLSNEDILTYIQNFQQMEDDLLKLYNYTFKKMIGKDIFTYLKMRDKRKALLILCRKFIVIIQNINDLESLDIFKILFIKLLGYFENDASAKELLNVIYGQTTWTEKSTFSSSKFKN